MHVQGLRGGAFSIHPQLNQFWNQFQIVPNASFFSLVNSKRKTKKEKKGQFQELQKLV